MYMAARQARGKRTWCGSSAPVLWRHSSHELLRRRMLAMSSGRPALLRSDTAVVLPPRVSFGLSCGWTH
jgi:hypothetical protein